MTSEFETSSINPTKCSVEEMWELNPYEVLKEYYFSYLNYSNQSWYYYKTMIPKSLELPFRTKSYCEATKWSIISIVCGYIYPFSSRSLTGNATANYTCKKPIFTIFSSHFIPLTLNEAEFINDIICKLSYLPPYTESRHILNNKIKFIKSKDLTISVINIFNGLFQNRFKFKVGTGNPTSHIRYFYSNRVIRNYEGYVSVNSICYDLLTQFLKSGIPPERYHYFNEYPVDALYPQKCTETGEEVIEDWLKEIIEGH